ncbi:hypothetical protein [Streptomyces sp. NPDC001165]|uniref:hypothetical protein n=1 Tax=Streptomyces sp. NPDC001165 TaxID=3364546 RepID=UPI00369FC770
MPAGIADRLGVDEDAAALCLQLLTLPGPERPHRPYVERRKAARHQKAAAVLVERGLAVEDRRPRGRKALPAGRVGSRQEALPADGGPEGEPAGAERSYNGRLENPLPLPTRTLPELFAHGWALVESGRGPSP